MTERRTLILLFALVAAQLVLLAAQVPSQRGQVSALENAALRFVAPPARWVRGVVDGLERVREGWRASTSLRSENRRLRAEVQRLRLEQVRLSGVELQLRNLGRALDYTPPSFGRVRVADVVYVDHASWLRTLVLYLEPSASSPTVSRDSPVATHDGLVGRVLGTPGPFVRVQLITDRASSVGAMIERTRRQGIVRGADAGQLALHYVPLQADVRPGDRIVTAGIDGVYPQGIRIGTVTQVERGDELFHRVRVQPAVELGRLDQVYVLEREKLPDEMTGGTTSASP